MNAEWENREFNTFSIRGLQVTKMLFITNVVTVYSSVQTIATLLDDTCCVRLHTRPVARWCAKFETQTF